MSRERPRRPFKSLVDAVNDYDEQCLNARRHDSTLTAAQIEKLGRYQAVVDFMAGAHAVIEIITHSRSTAQLNDLLDEIEGFGAYMIEKWGVKTDEQRSVD